ncbi:MAG: hypothetical protein M3O82_09255 [Verrucomicrobiota bacterium]|nr:hypothetical protein [Verrucomicrobiota bacterium]
MKTAYVIATMMVLSVARLNSQAPPAALTPLASIQQMKAANQALIEQQQKTLQVLDDLGKEAEQLKVMGKRT